MIPGVGRSKLERYADAVLRVVRGKEAGAGPAASASV